MRRQRISSFLVFLLLFPALSTAQKNRELPPSAYKLISVTVTGSEHFTPDDLTSASGLQIGETVHEDDFRTAARVLGDTGAFTEVSFSFDYSPNGTRLHWQVKDASLFVPVQFENFVWFSDRALMESIRQFVPLFHGELPAHGRLLDQVTEALQAVLAQKSIPGSVDCVRLGPDDASPTAFSFRVAGLRIVVRDVEVSGAGPDESQALQTAAKKFRNTIYLRSTVQDEAKSVLLPVYLARGYLKASFGEPQVKVVDSGPDSVMVDVTFTVDRGAQYKLSEIALTGNHALPAETLRAQVHAKLNQPADAVEIENDMAAIKQLYGEHGFLDAAVKSQPEIDDAASSVRYALNISEGEMYKMGELEIHGLDDKTTARLQNEWTLRAGDTYDSTYVQRFLAGVYKEIGDWNVKVDETRNQDHTVDVTLRFDSKN